MPQGVITYDPVHRVPYKQEIATKRTYAQKGMSHLTRLIADKSIQGRILKSAKRHLVDLANDPYIWTRLGKNQASVSQVETLYTLLQEIAVASDDPSIEAWLDIVENRLIKTDTKPWTAIVKVDPRTTSRFLRQIRGQGIKISNPAWGPHITFIRGEEPPPKMTRIFSLGSLESEYIKNGTTPWNIRDGETCDFGIVSEPKSNRQGHWWVDVQAPELNTIRSQLGLPAETTVPLHLTIGKEQ